MEPQVLRRLRVHQVPIRHPRPVHDSIQLPLWRHPDRFWTRPGLLRQQIPYHRDHYLDSTCHPRNRCLLHSPIR